MIYNKTTIKKDDFNDLFQPIKDAVKKIYFTTMVFTLISVLSFIIGLFVDALSLFSYIMCGCSALLISLSICLTIKVNSNFKKVPDELVFNFEFDEKELRCTTVVDNNETKSVFLYDNLVRVEHHIDEYRLYINQTTKYHVKENGFDNDDLEIFKKLIENVKR